MAAQEAEPDLDDLMLGAIIGKPFILITADSDPEAGGIQFSILNGNGIEPDKVAPILAGVQSGFAELDGGGE